MPQTFTITFGDQAENHVGMEKLGQLVSNGFSVDQLRSFQTTFHQRGFATELHCLNDLLDDRKMRDESTEAYVLVVREGLRGLLLPPEEKEEEVDNNDRVEAFYREQEELEKDTKAWMYGRVVNKHARHNLCFDDVGHASNYEQGQGTVIAFHRVPLLSLVRQSIERLTGYRLVAEGNYYFDVSKCGIGYHGDAERRLVIGIRVGEEMPLHYRWYRHSEVVSRTLKLRLSNGDFYVMSEKATGFDWKLRSTLTLRHAAGSSKFLDEANDRV